MNNKLVLGGVIVALLMSGVALMSSNTVVERTIEKAVGAFSGPNIYNRVVFNAGFQSGGSTLATSSTASTYTLLSAELDQDVTYISWNAGLNVTLTTMASTSMDFVGNVTGDKRVYDFYSATTTAATTITFAAGTGVDMQEDEGETVIVNGLEAARLTFIRKADSDVLFEVEVFQVGD